MEVRKGYSNSSMGVCVKELNQSSLIMLNLQKLQIKTTSTTMTIKSGRRQHDGEGLGRCQSQYPVSEYEGIRAHCQGGRHEDWGGGGQGESAASATVTMIMEKGGYGGWGGVFRA